VGPLSAGQLAQFDRDGYLAFPDVLTRSEIDTACTALSTLIRQNAATPGKLGRLLVQFEPGIQADSADELRVRKLMWFCEVHPFLDGLAHRHPKIRESGVFT
jgi:hypothetical protein